MIPKKLGRFEIVREIGRGAMGQVLLAHDPKIDRQVALKTLATSPAISEEEARETSQRFLREAQAAGKLLHPHIVTIFDVGEDAGLSFIAMEYIDGVTLERHARADSLLPPARLLELMTQAGGALDYAHQAKVIHRDIKPANLMVQDGNLKVTDFGLAKNPSASLTQTGVLLGTPSYMSPEQAGGMRVDARSDIYSLGAIMYELFCGQPMFRGKSFGEYVRKHLNVQPTPPRQTAGGAMMSERLEAVILRCLQKSVERRYPTIEALRDDLVGLLCQHDSGLINARDLGGIPGSVRRGLSALRGLAPFRSPGPTGSGLDLDEGVRTSIAVAPRRWPWLAGVVGLATAAVAIGVLVGSGRPSGAGRAAGALPAAATAPIATPVLAPPTPAPIPSPAPTVDPAEPAPPKAIAREPRGEREIRRDDARGRGEKAKTRRGDRRRAADDRGRAKRAATAPVVKPAAAIEPPAPPPSPPPANSDKPTRPARVDPTDTLDPFR